MKANALRPALLLARRDLDRAIRDVGTGAAELGRTSYMPPVRQARGVLMDLELTLKGLRETLRKLDSLPTPDTRPPDAA